MAGIAEQLRQAVLQAAIQGKLTEQLPEDGDARELLAEIRAEKERLIEEKTIRKEKELKAVTEDELDFTIPQNWAVIRLGNLGIFRKGPFGSTLTKSMFVPKSSDAIKVYEQKNAIQKDATLGEYYITKEYYETKMKTFEVFPDDIIVSCAGTIGETYILPENIEKGIINQALMKITLFPQIDARYFLLYFDFSLKKNAQENSKGSAIKNIPPFDTLKNYSVPVPPISEQKRIVARVNELMTKIDELEKIETDLRALHKAFPGDMKSALLQAAMQGRLTEQRPEDGNANSLKEKIQNERKKAGKCKPVNDIPAEDMESIPPNWQMLRTENVLALTDGEKVSNVQLPYLEARYLRGKVTATIKEEGKRVNAGQHLILVDGENSGEVFLAPEDGIMGSTFKVLFIPECVLTSFVQYFLKMNQGLLRDNKKGAAIPHLNKDVFRNMLFPIPPLAEQQRIVDKLDKLLPICDDLQENL